MARRIDEGRPGAAQAFLNPQEPNPLLRYEYDRGSSYETDTRVTTALGALIPEAELHSPDHRMFQIVHLVNEYLWVAMHHELRRLSHALDGDDFGLAVRVLDRVNGLAEMPVGCIRLLQDFLPQSSFLRLRDLLPANTSGLDSPGSRNLRRACKAVWQSFEAARLRADVSITDLMEEHGRDGGPAPAPSLGGLAAVQSGLHTLDCTLMEWNQLHLRLVRSHLGGSPASIAEPRPGSAHDGPRSLRGAPAEGLERIAERSAFPLLWQNVDDAYRRANEKPALQQEHS